MLFFFLSILIFLCLEIGVCRGDSRIARFQILILRYVAITYCRGDQRSPVFKF